MSDHQPWPSESLSTARDSRIARLCQEFETACQTGQQPQLEAFLGSWPDCDRFVLLRELLRIEMQFRCLANESPTLEEYRRRFPNDAPAIEAAFRAAPTVIGRPALDSGGTTLEGPEKPDEKAASRSGIPGYRMLEPLPSGGMGIVYRARQIDPDRIVALKMIRSGIHADPQELARFRIESEAIASLSHPHVIKIYDWGEWNGVPYLSMEFAENGSFAEQLQKGPLPPEEATGLLEKLALATQFIHERGIIHRDLKPANVLLTRDGTPKLADFGLAKRLDQDQGLTQTHAVLGTASYMAPEQAAGNIHSLGPAVDIYALGAILYEALTGRPPFRAETREQTIHQVLTEEPRRPTQIRAEVPAELELVCLKCLEKLPEHRFGSAKTLAENLASYRRREPLSLGGATLRNRLARVARRSGFEILDALNAGAEGTQFRAKDVSLGRIVVLELLATGKSADTRFRERVRARAAAAANLHHANIVELYSFGELDGEPFIAREFVEGKGICEGLEGSARALEQVALEMEAPARAVHHAHLQGIVHGNLGPDKVLRDAGGTCKITGYGVGSTEDRQLRSRPQEDGALGIAGNQTSRGGLVIDAAEDVLSLGVILYQLLNGHPPPPAQAIRSESDLPRKLISGLQGELQAICQKCLETDPAQRYVNAAALGEDLRRARGGEILLIDDLDDWAQQQRWARRAGYKVVELLGQSEEGFTYKAVHVATDRNLVLKRISARYRFVPAAKERFRLEARLLAGLHHPNIASLCDLGEQNDLVYYAREFVDGQSLARWAEPPQPGEDLTARTKASEKRRLEKTARLVCTLARTVQHLHDHKFVHGGLNPANVHVTPLGVPKITGFRRTKLSNVGSAGLSAEGDLSLPTRFLAPEQLDGVRRRPERTVDVYALGAIFYMLLTGSVPKVETGSAEKPNSDRSSWPVPAARSGPIEHATLEVICRRCMATEPSRRLATAGELADELEGILD